MKIPAWIDRLLLCLWAMFILYLTWAFFRVWSGP